MRLWYAQQLLRLAYACLAVSTWCANVGRRTYDVADWWRRLSSRLGWWADGMVMSERARRTGGR